jgi:hypothetical protein
MEIGKRGVIIIKISIESPDPVEIGVKKPKGKTKTRKNQRVSNFERY